MASNTKKLSIKLLIDRKANRVIFAEAGKELVDFLFSLLTLPVGNIIGLTEHKEVGCFGKLYDSVERLSDVYVQTSQSKNLLLKPQTISSNPNNVLLLVPNTTTSTGSATGGYVKDVVKYILMDDLVIMAMPTISALDLLELNITNASSLEEVEVELGTAEGMELLKAVVRSKTVLTDVFLKKKSFYDATCKKDSAQLNRVCQKRFPATAKGAHKINRRLVSIFLLFVIVVITVSRE